MKRLTEAPKWIWAFEDEPGGVPKSGVWFEEKSECPQGSPQYVRSDIVAKMQADLDEARMQSLADAGQAADALDRAVKAEADNAALRADLASLKESETHYLNECDRLRAALAAERGIPWQAGPPTDDLKDGREVLVHWSYVYPGDDGPTEGATVTFWNGAGWDDVNELIITRHCPVTP